MANLYIIAAPSGAGKTSLVAALVNALPDICVSISHTTRAPRPGEQDGVNYFFTERDVFEQHIHSHTFLEYALVFDNYYGTSKHWVEQQLAAGIDVILEIDWQGARQVKQLLPQSTTIFILPPSREVLRQRLQQRGQDSEQVIAHRMQQADAEMSHYNEYDYLIFNDNFEHALAELQIIVQANRLRLAPQREKYRECLAQLLPKQVG